MVWKAGRKNMQAGRIQGRQQSYQLLEPKVQDELSSLGFDLICRLTGFSVPRFIPPGFINQGIEGSESSEPLQRICDRTLKQWPPRESRERLYPAHLLGQLGLLFSQGRVPEPQLLLDTLYTLSQRGEMYAMAFIKCLVCYGVGVDISTERWQALGRGGLPERVQRWAQVVFFTDSPDKKEDYERCSHQLIIQEMGECTSHEAIPALLKYWVVQGMPLSTLLELFITIAGCDSYLCSWKTILSSYNEPDSVWQLLRERYPGQLDNFNSLMAELLPDGRSVFIALWQKCKEGSSIPDTEVLVKLTVLGVDLNADIRPGKTFLDELAHKCIGKNFTETQSLSEELFKHLKTESDTREILPRLFACITTGMSDDQKILLLASLCKSGRTMCRWSDLFETSDQFAPAWRQVIPGKLKRASDLLSIFPHDAGSYFIDFWNQERKEALKWLFEYSDLVGTPLPDKNFLNILLAQLLATSDSTNLHIVTESLEKYRRAGIDIPDACQRHLFQMILTKMKSKPKEEHIMGGCMRLLRFFAEGNRGRLNIVSELSKIAWQNFMGDNTPLPRHIAAIALGGEEIFQHTLQDLLSYFPEQVSLFSFEDPAQESPAQESPVQEGSIEGSNIEERAVDDGSDVDAVVNSRALALPRRSRPSRPCRLIYRGGHRWLPQGTVLHLDGHGEPGCIAGRPATELASRVFRALKSRCQTLPDRIVLEACEAARSAGGRSPSSAEMFAISWFQHTQKPVSILAYEGKVWEGLFHRQRLVTHTTTNAYNLRPRCSRELMVSLSAAGQIKKIWRPLKSANHFPRQLRFSLNLLESEGGAAKLPRVPHDASDH